ncbi:hypothetical protein LXA43DRAFT_567115 [Ganoderma leucocontextum]|nr:hypothetical protein LXA43DRAFT_567115 [Ganoderma leucocontextum]
MYHHWHHAQRCGRATSRLFWFVAGAATATWWHCHKDYHAWQNTHRCGRDRIPQHAYPAPGAPPPPSPTATAATDAHGPTPGTVDKWDRWGWGHWGRGSWPGQENASGGNGNANGNGNWDRWGWGNRGPNARPEGAWGPPMPTSNEKVPEKDIMEQATETIADLSEATLNNLLVTVESLKAKLAEHRTQREQQESELQALREAREAKFKQFQEWQRQQEQEQKKDQGSRRLV